MSDTNEKQTGTPEPQDTTTPPAEPPVDALSDEALESVAGGCQVGTSVPEPWEPPPTIGPWTEPTW